MPGLAPGINVVRRVRCRVDRRNRPGHDEEIALTEQAFVCAAKEGASARYTRGMICSSSKARRCITAGSRSPVLAARRTDSASRVTWVELTGSGRAATAPSSACVISAIRSGENEASEKSFIGRDPQQRSSEKSLTRYAARLGNFIGNFTRSTRGPADRFPVSRFDYAEMRVSHVQTARRAELWRADQDDFTSATYRGRRET